MNTVSPSLVLLLLWFSSALSVQIYVKGDDKYVPIEGDYEIHSTSGPHLGRNKVSAID